MKKSDKKKIEEFIRVDHAGERGAIKIYEGQLLALNTFVKDDELKKTIEEMKEHEKKKYQAYKIFTIMGFTRRWFRFRINFIRKKGSDVMHSIG